MGIQHIIDGADEDQLRNLLEGSTYFMKQRQQKGAAMLDMIAATAPALGLCFSMMKQAGGLLYRGNQ